MLDITGDLLLTYLIREIKDVVSAYPRFKESGGGVLAQSSSGVSFGDCRVEVSSVSSSGNRLSPDYFLYTQYGHSVMGKLPNKDGRFVEWVDELPGHNHTPAVYYLYIDKVNEKTRDLDIIIKTFRWKTGRVQQAEGSIVYLREGLDSVQISEENPQQHLTPLVSSLALTQITPPPFSLTHNNQPLEPLVDYWLLQDVETPLGTTLGGEQRFILPDTYPDVMVVDSLNQFVLRPNIDYVLRGNVLVTSFTTPPGSELIIRSKEKYWDATRLINQENFILPPTEVPILETLWAKPGFGQPFTHLLNTPMGWCLPRPLAPGESLQWDVKVDAGDQHTPAAKSARNDNLISGLSINIGDNVVAGDESAIIVTSDLSQTYEVFGSTDDISFTIKVVANDRDTVTDLSNMIKEHLLVRSRARHSAAGLNIQRISAETTMEPRDESGVHMSAIRQLSIEATAEWRYYVPLISRIRDFDISDVKISTEYPKHMTPDSFGAAYGLRAWTGRTIA